MALPLNPLGLQTLCAAREVPLTGREEEGACTARTKHSATLAARTLRTNVAIGGPKQCRRLVSQCKSAFRASTGLSACAPLKFCGTEGRRSCGSRLCCDTSKGVSPVWLSSLRTALFDIRDRRLADQVLSWDKSALALLQSRASLPFTRVGSLIGSQRRLWPPVPQLMALLLLLLARVAAWNSTTPGPGTA